MAAVYTVFAWLLKPLTARRANYLEPISLTKVPVEIKPLVKAINDLFERLDAAFTREKRFAADAAHELRTPLAAVMIQAQVAANAENTQERLDALNKVLAGVNRSTHVVDQLLTMSKMLPDATVTDMDDLDLVKLVAEVIAHQVPKALAKNITIGAHAPQTCCYHQRQCNSTSYPDTQPD